MNDNKELQLFNYNDNNVRTVIKDGEPWFVAKDVCAILGLSDVSMAVCSLDDDELAQVKLVSGGQFREMKAINESGLYWLILRSRKPEAKMFQRWVTHDVLPTIRKTGGAYMTIAKAEELLANPDLIIGLAQQVIQLKADKARLAEENANHQIDVWRLNKIAEEVCDQRDHAVATKAHISDKKTATAMGKLGGAMNANRILKEKLGIAENYQQVRAIPWINEYFDVKLKGTYIVVGNALAKLSKECGVAL